MPSTHVPRGRRLSLLAILCSLLLLLLHPVQAQDTTELSSDSATTSTAAPSSAISTDSLTSPAASDSTNALSSITSAPVTTNTTVTAAPTSTTSTNTTTSTNSTDASCQCGFFDPLTNRTYTDSLIVYFNETLGITPDFNVSDFEHRYEKGWTTYYLQGAKSSNVYYTNGSIWNIDNGWLNLNVSGYTPDKHVTNGAQLDTKRQDLLYGSFRALMKSPQPYASGGSSMAMRLWHNESFSAELDLLNMDNSGNDSHYATTTNMMDPLWENGINYTYLLNPPWNVDWWNFWEYRIDWTPDGFDWFIGQNKTRSLAANNYTLPMMFSLKHWSNGDENWMQGPPVNDSGAAVGWVRAFFNSSLAQTVAPPPNCSAALLCSTEDTTLRLTSTYPLEALEPSEALEPVVKHKMSNAAIGLAVASVILTAALFALGLLSKSKTKGRKPSAFARHKHVSSESELKTRYTSTTTSSNSLTHFDNLAPTMPNTQGVVHKDVVVSSERPLLNQFDSNVSASTPAATDGAWHDIDITTVAGHLHDKREAGVSVAGNHVATQDTAGMAGALPGASESAKVPAATVPAGGQKPAVPQRTRVDYLAGLVALCSLLVSCTHFMLTFCPAVIMEYLPRHYNSEYWARATIEPFFFNEIWVGLFFTTSTRFLCTGYLRKQDLKIIAEKVTCRTPRLMIPIVSVILFVYFLMDCGATTYLEYIPSITWSTWPNTHVYNNFGWFFDETLQLIFLIPNAAPQLTWNFATGVLWTIPVQLQNTWLVLLGAVVISEIKTPWKRFGYYAFCIINHWYAMSWGSYFWFGLLLADLDITYKYRQKIQAHAYYLYPLLTAATALVFVSLGNDLLSFWTGWTFSIEERNIHPDLPTGLNIGSTADAGYPDWTEPKLNGLVFCVAAQFIVEISVWAQKFLSTKPFLLLFPHVFTMYLIHGLVFWSIGSLVCWYFAKQGLVYWLNILLTALISYATLFAALPIVTPVMEMLGKEVTKSIWVAASEEPARWRPTTWPVVDQSGEEKREQR